MAPSQVPSHSVPESWVVTYPTPEEAPDPKDRALPPLLPSHPMSPLLPLHWGADPGARGLGRTQGSQQWLSAFLAGGMSSVLGPSHQGTSVARRPAWRGSRWVRGTAGASAGQVLRVGRSVGREAGVLARGPGLSLGHSRMDGIGYVSEHQPAGPLQWALRWESGLQRDSQGRQGR